MKTLRHYLVVVGVLLLAISWQARAESSSTPKTNEVAHFDSMQVGTRTYSNVTVTARTATDVFVRHQKGIANFKPEELPIDVQERLGFRVSAPANTGGGVAAVIPAVVSRTLTAAKTNEFLALWAKKVKARITADTGSGPAEDTDTNESGDAPTSLAALTAQIPQTVVVAGSFFLAALPVLYFFFCYTARLICQKAGSRPGAMIWFPILSLVPLTRAARLPAWAAAFFLVPLINLPFMIVWCVKIARARGKGVGTAICLIFPITSPWAWLYLAYSK